MAVEKKYNLTCSRCGRIGVALTWPEVRELMESHKARKNQAGQPEHKFYAQERVQDLDEPGLEDQLDQLHINDNQKLKTVSS